MRHWIKLLVKPSGKEKIPEVKRVYLDHNATTPLDPRVKAVMNETADIFGNPSSSHYFGNEAYELVEQSRALVASLISVDPKNIYFTSGATESNNLAITGISEWLLRNRSNEVLNFQVNGKSHKSVLEPVLAESKKWEPFQKEADGHSIVYTVEMLANNETGNTQIGETDWRNEYWFAHVDASQGMGYLTPRLNNLITQSKVTSVAISSHKMYGPKGVGALYIKPETKRHILPLFLGGGQESDIRSGTHNVMGIVGFGEACRIMKLQGHEETESLQNKRSLLHFEITQHCSPKLRKQILVNTNLGESHPGTISIYFPKVKATQLIMALPNIAMSSGSACSARGGEDKLSHVLAAMYPDDIDRQQCSVRLSVGRFTTEDDIRFAASEIGKAASRLCQ